VLGYHLNFQNLFIRTNINLIFVFVLKILFSKNPCENMGSCLFFWERKKGKTLKNSWCSGFVSTKCAQCVIYMKAHYEHIILLTRKTHLTEKVLWHYELNCQQD
jgi:hypothetical protein